MFPNLKSKDAQFCLGFALILVGACNPYERRSGDYSAGSVDPAKFPAAYLGNPNEDRPQLGLPGDPTAAGGGTFQYVTAFVRGQQLAYYPLPFTGAQTPAAGKNASQNQLDLNKLLPLAPKPLTIAYVFDAEGVDPSQDSNRCNKPEGYMYDPVADAVRYDRQGNIYTVLPAETMPAGATRYVPIVQEVTVRSNGLPCQSTKSAANLVKRTDVSMLLDPPPAGVPNVLPTGHPGSRYLVHALIDPAADVFYPQGTFPTENCALGDTSHDPVTCLGPQRWGWYQQYLVAYLDGGEVKPKASQPGDATKVMETQNLYYPDTIQMNDPDKPGMKMDVPGDLGMGLDLMDFRRGEDNYSPICHVFTFTPKNTAAPEKSVADIDLTKVKDTHEWVYCLQLPAN